MSRLPEDFFVVAFRKNGDCWQLVCRDGKRRRIEAVAANCGVIMGGAGVVLLGRCRRSATEAELAAVVRSLPFPEDL